jgi:hypothetical protein
MDELLNKIKASIRITHDKLNEDVADTIEACLADLKVCGLRDEKLDTTKELDPLILNAVKLYCKAAYTDDPVKAARYQGGYDAMKSCLMYAEGYSWKEAGTDE